MALVKIKSQNTKDPVRRFTLLEILSKNDIYATKIIPIVDGFIVLLSNDNEMDKIFNNKTNKELEANQFFPQIPAELRGNRSVMIFNVDQHIYGNKEDTIKEEIMARNLWTTGIIDQLYKFPASKTIKITFNQAALAKKTIEKGLLLFSMSIPSHQIQQEVYYNIKMCMRCYILEDHNTNQCTKEKEYKICSECAEIGHTWRECPNESKKMYQLPRRTPNQCYEMPKKKGNFKE